MTKLKELQVLLQTSFSTLSVRERRMVASAAAALVAFLLFIITFTLGNQAEAIRRRTEAKILKMQEVQTLAAGYNQARAKQTALEQQLATSNVRLISYLEEKAKQAGLELPSINPRADVHIEGTKILEGAVEVTLTDVPLSRLIAFLTLIESGPALVKVRYMRLEPRPAEETITAWLTVASYHLKS